MPARVILGKRGSDYGLFVSQKDVDVLTTSSTTPLAFDSRATRGMVLKAKGEGSLAPAASNASGIGSPTTVTISHGLGYIPLFAVRWCIASELSSGVATLMRNPHYYEELVSIQEVSEDEGDEYEATESEYYGVQAAATSSNLVISNYYFGGSGVVTSGTPFDGYTEYFGVGKKTIYYTYIIFKAKDFTGGIGL